MRVVRTNTVKLWAIKTKTSSKVLKNFADLIVTAVLDADSHHYEGPLSNASNHQIHYSYKNIDCSSYSICNALISMLYLIVASRVYSAPRIIRSVHHKERATCPIC